MNENYNKETISVIKGAIELLYEVIDTDKKQLLTKEVKDISFFADAQEKIYQAEIEIANNKGVDAKESLKILKEKYDL